MSIKPFADQGHYTVVHDAILDRVMPKCPPNAWKVLCLIIRKTRGWKKGWDAISYSQIKEGTGIKGDPTVTDALKWLMKKNLVIRSEGEKWSASSYALNQGFELADERGYSTKEIEVEPTKEIEDTRTTLENHSRRESDDSQRTEKTPDQINWFDVYAERCKDYGFAVSDEDRNRHAGNLRRLVMLEGATHAEMNRAIGKILDDKTRGYIISPQEALNKVRGVPTHSEQQEPGRRSKEWI